MKTNLIKSLLVTIILIVFTLQGFGQCIGTQINVKGAHYGYSDVAYVFSDPSTTYYFDNGYDGSKMLGTPDAPQIYIPELDGIYQVAAIPDVNNCYLTFTAGLDTTYTFTFNNQYLSLMYQGLYLIDSVANQVIDIYTSGTTYTFQATNRTPMNRFKFVTSNPLAVVTPTPTPDPVVTPAPNPVVTPTPTPVVTPTTPTTPSATDDKGNNKDNKKKLNIYNSKKTVYVDNPGKKGKLKICSATTGRVLQTIDFKENGITTIPTNVSTGSYLLNGDNSAENVAVTVLMN